MSDATNSRPLAGKGIVVTRPAHQAQSLARMIEAAGAHPILFPAIEIRDLEDPGPLTRVIDRLEEFDLAIFISPNAAERAMRFISARRKLPSGLRVATIGGGGVRALAAHDVTGVISPRGRYDSEALLELAEIAGARRVVIFRGVGGRELLGETLKSRGAQVEYAECYRRQRPVLDPARLLEAWARNELDAVTATSSEGLRNLFEMVGNAGREQLQHTPLFVPHPRIAETARGHEVATVVVSGPGDDGLLAALTAYFGAAG